LPSSQKISRMNSLQLGFANRDAK